MHSYGRVCFAILLWGFLFCGDAAAEPRVDCAPFSGKFTQLHRSGGRDSNGNGLGTGLCWDGKPVRLIGYYSFDAVTRERYDDGKPATEDPHYDYSSFLNSLQIVSGPVSNSANKNRGVNLTRISAFGSSNVPEGCLVDRVLDPGRPTTRMPFQTTNGDCSPKNTTPKYTMCSSSAVCGGTKFQARKDEEGLDDIYFARLKDALEKAKDNGVVVELILFDRLSLQVQQRGNPRYFYSPFNPVNNNMDERPIFKNGKGGYEACTVLPRSTNRFYANDALPEFYDICRNKSNLRTCKSSLNCLGIIQKKYVQKIVETVRKSRATNVIFEIMNEAHLNDHPDPTRADWKTFALWHEVVGQWVKDFSRKEFLVSGSVFVGGEDQYELMNQCTSKESCDNEFRIFHNKNLDVVTLQGRSWVFVGACTAATTALKRFGKPVIIDTDGVPERIKKDQCKVLNLARDATVNDQTGDYCRPRGEVHFNHIDGITLGRGNVNEAFLDCKQIDLLGDLVPTELSDIITPDTAPASCGSKRNPVTWKYKPCKYVKTH